MIENKVKLVIWDLDDSFWTGTLLEGGIVPVARNVEMVKELSKRGIVNSICSKNDYAEVKARLTELGIWEYFVFPHIAFSPKGKAVADMLENAGLRAENTLFIDDNLSNLEEVKFFSPGIMAAHPDDVLDALLDHPHCAGKPDPELTRLKQYQFLQRKVEERSSTSLSNAEFLRASNIRVRIDYEVEANFDRVVELINRTNQLNYTKKRLENDVALKRFRQSLGRYGYHSGCVWVADNYGDYGLAGFFQMKRRSSFKKLEHFVFSCRTMNMGIEQYVYEMLDKPDIEIAEPVSYGLETHEAIDWINSGDTDGEKGESNGGKLVLLGGCDMLQLANYCSTNRLEFANMAKGDISVRYDEPGFILTDREVLRENREFLPTWSYEDALRFDEGIATADLILLCMYGAVNGAYFRLNDAVDVRVPAQLLEDTGELAGRIEPLDWDVETRTRMVLECFDAVDRRAASHAHIFVIGYSSRGAPNEKQMAKRRAFNKACRDYCGARDPRFRFADVDTLIPREELVGVRHFSPAGFFILARHILSTTGMAGPALASSAPLRSTARPGVARGEPVAAV